MWVNFYLGRKFTLPNSSVLVIGADIAGITVAQRLVENNIKVYLIEKESYIGGQALSYGCKGVEICFSNL